LLDALSPGNPWNRDIVGIFAAVTHPMTTVVRRHDEGKFAGAVRALRETEQLVDRGVGGQHCTAILGGHPPGPMAGSIRVGEMDE
jgi:hypothetical protein